MTGRFKTGREIDFSQIESWAGVIWPVGRV
jgi:hypothetical protein